MSDRFITMTSSKLSTEGLYYINNSTAILALNIDCHNGIVHLINEAYNLMK